jgi:hypothetical protein
MPTQLIYFPVNAQIHTLLTIFLYLKSPYKIMQHYPNSQIKPFKPNVKKNVITYNLDKLSNNNLTVNKLDLFLVYGYCKYSLFFHFY